ncbi:hypothetical protein EUGRSUZ_K01537 [Eucalyptus grandis]|uniref:Uncharacterized protein n=2 Tax=Eucalyptus grandis TaxID=71139 RepID=A0ACC3IWI5_EUCGR|nr:hypothetical protein EUGRSUZ_K01537 [Eucalyptus grandis]
MKILNAMPIFEVEFSMKNNIKKLRRLSMESKDRASSGDLYGEREREGIDVHRGQQTEYKCVLIEFPLRPQPYLRLSFRITVRYCSSKVTPAHNNGEKPKSLHQVYTYFPRKSLVTERRRSDQRDVSVRS